MINEVVKEFVRELAKFQARTNPPDWHCDELILKVAMCRGKAGVEIKFDGNVTVKGVDLGKVMDEVYRRVGYNEKTEGEIQAASQALLGLPAPKKML